MDKLSFNPGRSQKEETNSAKELMVLCLGSHPCYFLPLPGRGRDVDFLVSISDFSSSLSANSASRTLFKQPPMRESLERLLNNEEQTQRPEKGFITTELSLIPAPARWEN